MGKHEPMSAKAIANKIKAKGLQKIKYYCEMCKKQCRDDNGFKCHIESEAHQRQALIVYEDPDKFVNEFSQQFMDGFMYLLRTRHRTKRVLANTVFQEYIKEKDHIHMNGTRWTTLTEFAYWLGEQGIVKVDDSERGVLITYIDCDPETLRRKDLDAKRAQQAKEEARREQKEIERQQKVFKKIYEELESKKEGKNQLPLELEPNMQLELDKEGSSNVDDIIEKQLDDLNNEPGTSTGSNKTTTTEAEKPLFKIQPISLKTATISAYKPPPPKRKVSNKATSDSRKKSKLA